MPDNYTPDQYLLHDPDMEHAMSVIFATYGDRTSLHEKNKDLHKFGRNRTTGTSVETVWNSPADSETFLTDNLINSLVSSSGSDTEEITVEGHTIADGNFTFVSQQKTLTGQTAVTLDTPLARCSRLYNNNGTALVGAISATETDTYTAGVPDTDAKVHCSITAGRNQSEKASTTISNTDYWVITNFYADMYTKQASFAEIILEIRHKGKVFRENTIGSVSSHHAMNLNFKPFLIIPPNADIRVRAISDTASGGGRDLGGGLQGYFLKVV